MRPLKNKPNVIAPTSIYPYGRVKDNPGDGTGTPVNEQVYGDIHQFFEKLMADAGMSPNNAPESVYDGFQLNEALDRLFMPKKIVPIGDWNMDADKFKSVSHGLPNYKKIRRVSVIIRDDADATYTQLEYPKGALDGSVIGGITSINSVNIDMYRFDTGIYDSVNYDSVSYNRGFVTIEYER